MELGASEGAGIGGGLTPYHSLSIGNPTGRERPCKLALDTLATRHYCPQQGSERRLASPSNSPASETITTQLMKTHYTQRSQVAPKVLFYSSLPNCPSSSMKECSSPLFSRLAYSSVFFLLLFLRNPSFAGKITSIFNFKPNTADQ